jgi:sugar lactone lactonase YvrE
MLFRKPTLKVRLAVVTVLIAGLVALPFALSPISPVSVRVASAAPPGPEYDVDYIALETGGPYPEGLVVEPDGGILVGHEDGSLARITLDDTGNVSSAETVVELSGHSIGLIRDEASDTYWSATFPLGLQQLGRQGVLRTIGRVDDIALGFPDDVALGRDGIVYVTDASTRHNPLTTKPNAPYVLWDFMEGRANGRLIAYDPATGETHTALDQLAFPSGVVLTQDGSALLIVEVTRYRVIRYELTGPDRGSVSVFADRLPGIPDDVFLDTQGRVWVSLVAPRDTIMDNWIAPYPYIARLISMLPWSVQNSMLAPADTGGRVIRLSDTGEPDCTLRLPDGPPPANGAFYDGKMLLGRLGGTALVRIDPEQCHLEYKSPLQ